MRKTNLNAVIRFIIHMTVDKTNRISEPSLFRYKAALQNGSSRSNYRRSSHWTLFIWQKKNIPCCAFLWICHLSELGVVQEFGWLLKNSARLKYLVADCFVAYFAGSPFQYSVGQLNLGGPHKVQVGGPGLEKGEVGIKSEYTKISFIFFLNFWKII